MNHDQNTPDPTRLYEARIAMLSASVAAVASDAGLDGYIGGGMDDLDDTARELVFARAQYDEDSRRAEAAP